jgi:hypothetical protein
MEIKKPSHKIKTPKTDSILLTKSFPIVEINQKTEKEDVKNIDPPNEKNQYIKIGHRLFTKSLKPTYKDTKSDSNNGVAFYSSNKECVICGEDINSSESPFVFFPKCKHIVHIKHGNKSILNEKCPICTPMNINNNGIKLLKKTENTKSPRKRSFDVPEDDANELEFLQSSNIIGSLNPLTINNTVINEEYLLKNNIKIRKLYELKINIKQIYHKIGIKTWESLLNIGFSKETNDLLLDEEFSDTETLVKLYHINKQDLWEDLGLSFLNLIEWGYSPKELSLLEYNIENMIEDGFTKKELTNIIENTDSGPRDMKDYLKMEKKHLYRLNIIGTDLKKWKNWKSQIVQKTFDLNQEDLEALKIICPKKKNTKQISTKNSEKQLLDLLEI